MEELLLERRVESLRLHMIELAIESDNLQDARVIQVSQKLDELIVKLQRLRMAHFYNRSHQFSH
jgi:hypothetical protein